jgi:hypothetical protein
MKTEPRTSEAREKMPTRVCISAQVLKGIVGEIDAIGNLETGGLLGCLRGVSGEIVLILGTGPGPDAKHGPTHLFLSQHSIPMVAERFEGLLGDASEMHSWHSHPIGIPASPSAGDIRSAHKALEASAQTGLLMVIVERGRARTSRNTRPHELGAYWIDTQGRSTRLPVAIFGGEVKNIQLLCAASRLPPVDAWYTAPSVQQALKALQLRLAEHGVNSNCRVYPETQSLWLQVDYGQFQIPRQFPMHALIRSNGRPLTTRNPNGSTLEACALKLIQESKNQGITHGE